MSAFGLVDKEMIVSPVKEPAAGAGEASRWVPVGKKARGASSGESLLPPSTWPINHVRAECQRNSKISILITFLFV